MDKTHTYLQQLAESHPYVLILLAIAFGLAIGVLVGVLLGYRLMLRPVQRRYQSELGLANEEIIRTKTEFSEYKRRVRRKLEREIARIRAQEVQIQEREGGDVVRVKSDDPAYEKRVEEYFLTTGRLFQEMQEAQQAMFEQMQRVNHRYTQVIDHVNRGAAALTGRLPNPEKSVPVNEATRARRPLRDDAPRPQQRSKRLRSASAPAQPTEGASSGKSRGSVSQFMADLQRANPDTVEFDPNDRPSSTRRPTRDPRRPRRGSLSK